MPDPRKSPVVEFRPAVERAPLVADPRDEGVSVPPKRPGGEYVSPKGGAEVLEISRSSFYRHVMPYVYSGQIRSLKIGACRRIHLGSLLAWAQQHANELAG